MQNMCMYNCAYVRRYLTDLECAPLTGESVVEVSAAVDVAWLLTPASTTATLHTQQRYNRKTSRMTYTEKIYHK